MREGVSYNVLLTHNMEDVEIDVECDGKITCSDSEWVVSGSGMKSVE